MMLSLLGEFDFWELYQIAPVVAPFLFVSYVLLCVIVALNVLIGQHPCACFVRACLSSPCHVAPGIITAAFDNAKEEIENAPARPIVGELYNCTSAVQHASAMASHRSRRCVRGDTDVMSTLERIPGLGRLVQRRQELLDDIVRTARVVEMQYVTVAVACSWVCVH